MFAGMFDPKNHSEKAWVLRGIAIAWVGYLIWTLA
jgi:hypothetical protein